MKTVLFVCVYAVVLAGVFVYSQSEDERACNRRIACEDCISGNATLECYWCTKPSNKSAPKCRHFSFNTAIPVDGIECDNLMYFVGNCRVNALASVIMIVLACLVFVTCLCCCCCCCCFFCAKRRQKRKMLEDDKYNDEKERIRQRSADRRAERQAKSDEIKRKYGLNNDGGEGTYRRLE